MVDLGPIFNQQYKEAAHDSVPFYYRFDRCSNTLKYDVGTWALT